jgi:hypothetical protein
MAEIETDLHCEECKGAWHDPAERWRADWVDAPRLDYWPRPLHPSLEAHDYGGLRGPVNLARDGVPIAGGVPASQRIWLETRIELDFLL